VAGDPTVDPEDVAQDLRAHVHAELEAVAEPVTVGALERVLDSLGTPAEWTGTARELPKERLHVRLEKDVMAAVRLLQERLATDLGMPLLVGVLSVIGLFTFADGGILLLALAYFVARSIATYAPETLKGRRRWLIYLPLAIGAGGLTAVVLSFPMVLEVGGRTIDGYSFNATAMWFVGLWWVFVGFIAGREVRRVRSLLKPFADGFERTHARMLMLIGAAFMIAATVDLMPQFRF
jgi:hypothetical protein